MSTKWMATFVACALCLLISCDSRSRTNAPPHPTLQSIAVSPANETVAEGLSQQFSATAIYSDGTSKPLSNAKWATSDAMIANVDTTGLVAAVKLGNVRVSASLGSITGSAEITVRPPNTVPLTEPRENMPVVPITSEGKIPADFNVADAMRSLYGNFDPSTQSSVSALPPGSEKDWSFDIKKGVKGIQVRPFWTAQTEESGVSKVYLGTYAGPLGEGYGCHGCAPLIGMAAFMRTGSGWVVETSTKTALFLGQWGEPPAASILRLGPDHVGVKLQGLGSFSSYVSILAPWNGEIREAFFEVVGEGNGQVCGEEAGMQPCVGTQKDITFVKGANPAYDDIVLTLSGTILTKTSPHKVVAVNGTERRTFSDGKYLTTVR